MFVFCPTEMLSHLFLIWSLPPPTHHLPDLHYTMHCGWLEGVLSLDGTLKKKEQQKRTMYLVISAVVLLVQLVSFGLITRKSRGLTQVGIGMISLGSACAIVLVLCKCKVTNAAVLALASSYLLGTLLIDWASQTVGGQYWSSFVLTVDFLLVMEVDARQALVVVVLCCIWIALTGAEVYFRFGLFDAPYLLPQHGEDSRWERYAEQGACTDLPCPNKTTLGRTMGALQVFVIDFIATRGFASAILKEQATMERTINTVQEIASLLAGYDVERVAELLAEHEGHLPEEMTSALRSLEENLRKYKAYLPQTCLPFERDEGTLHEKKVSLKPEEQNDITQDGKSCSSISEETTASSRKMAMNFQVQTLSLSLSSTKATLLTLNIKDTLRLLDDDITSFSQLFTSVLLSVLDATDVRRGMVDVFVGDRIHCSFNASRKCGNHATSALYTATMLIQGGDEVRTHVNMGVATGKVLRGDMGCHVMRRFSMVGALVRDVLAIERAGRVLGCDVLCNRLCFSDAECEHNLRLIPCKVELAANCEVEVLGELVVPLEAPAETEVDEWMYQIGAKKDWDDYNQAVRQYLKGETSAEDVAIAATKGNCALYPVHVVASSLQHLCFPVCTNKTSIIEC